MIGQAWQTLRWALEDLGSALRDFLPWNRHAPRAPDAYGPGNRPVGVCSGCGGTVWYSPVARLASCGKGCTTIVGPPREEGDVPC